MKTTTGVGDKQVTSLAAAEGLAGSFEALFTQFNALQPGERFQLVSQLMNASSEKRFDYEIARAIGRHVGYEMRFPNQRVSFEATWAREHDRYARRQTYQLEVFNPHDGKMHISVQSPQERGDVTGVCARHALEPTDAAAKEWGWGGSTRVQLDNNGHVKLLSMYAWEGHFFVTQDGPNNGPLEFKPKKAQLEGVWWEQEPRGPTVDSWRNVYRDRTLAGRFSMSTVALQDNGRLQVEIKGLEHLGIGPRVEMRPANEGRTEWVFGAEKRGWMIFSCRSRWEKTEIFWRPAC